MSQASMPSPPPSRAAARAAAAHRAGPSRRARSGPGPRSGGAADPAAPGVAALLRPTTSQLVDLLGCGALVALALVGFGTTYAGMWWILAAAIGLLLGLAVAHVTAALRLPGVVAALGVALAYVAVAPVLTAKDGLTPLGTVTTTAVTGWKQLLTTLPPVESRGPLVALPLLFALVGAATAYGVARRWQGAARALVVPVVLLVLSILLGTLTPAALLWQGGAFALAAIGYAAVRASRGLAALQNGAGATTRAVTVGVLLALATGGAILLGPHLPGSGDAARTVWRTSLEPPFDLARFPSPLAGFRKFTEPNSAALFDRQLLTVEGLPAGTPIAFARLDTYDGSVWGAGSASGATAAGPGSVAASGGSGGGLTALSGTPFRRVGSRLAAEPPPDLPNPRETQLTFGVPEGGWSEVWLPTSGTVTGIDFTGPRAETLRADLRFNADTDTGILPARLAAGDTYRLTAYLEPAATQLPTDLTLANGTTVDTGSLAFLDPKLDAWAGRETDRWRRLLAVAATFRGAGAYTDGGSGDQPQNVFLPGHSLARVTRFVKATQLAGDDEQYAAALALVAARLGVPSRVVLGALPDATGVVKGSDVHAWVEVMKADGQWQTILPQHFLPDRNKKPTQQDERSDQRNEGAAVPPPAANSPPSILQGPDQAQNTTPNRTQAAKKSLLDPSSWPDWLRWVVLAAGPPLLVVGLVVGAIVGAKARRRARRRTRGSTAARIEGGWAELLDTATDLGIRLPGNATRVEQARALATAATRLPASAAPAAAADAAAQTTPTGPGTTAATAPGTVLELARVSDGHIFGPTPPSDAAARGFWDGVSAAIGGLQAAAPRTRRWRATLSLRSLRRTEGGAAPRTRLVRRSATARRVERLRRATASTLGGPR